MTLRNILRLPDWCLCFIFCFSLVPSLLHSSGSMPGASGSLCVFGGRGEQAAGDTEVKIFRHFTRFWGGFWIFPLPAVPWILPQLKDASQCRDLCAENKGGDKVPPDLRSDLWARFDDVVTAMGASRFNKQLTHTFQSSWICSWSFLEIYLTTEGFLCSQYELLFVFKHIRRIITSACMLRLSCRMRECSLHGLFSVSLFPNTPSAVELAKVSRYIFRYSVK